METNNTFSVVTQTYFNFRHWIVLCVVEVFMVLSETNNASVIKISQLHCLLPSKSDLSSYFFLQATCLGISTDMTPVSCNMTSGEMTFGMTDGMPLVMISDKLSVVYHKNQVRTTKNNKSHTETAHTLTPRLWIRSSQVRIEQSAFLKGMLDVTLRTIDISHSTCIDVGNLNFIFFFYFYKAGKTDVGKFFLGVMLPLTSLFSAILGPFWFKPFISG